MSHGITTNDQMFSVPPSSVARAGRRARRVPEVNRRRTRQGGPWLEGHARRRAGRQGAAWTDDFGTKHPAELVPAKGFKANLREDTGEVLGIVSDEYEVVDNRDAFRFLDALIGSELHFETAGSLWGGRRVWVLARLPEFIELGGDQSATYVYVANSHDGSMAVTAAATPIRIVCANTLGAALRQAEDGAHANRTFRFRHTGNLQAKFAEARRVLGMTVNYQSQFKALADRLAREPISEGALERRVLGHLWVTDDENLGRRARENRERTIERVLDIFRGRGIAGDTTGNSPGTKWTAFNAIAEHLDYGRRYTSRTSQIQRSFEDAVAKQRALDLVRAA